MFWMGNLEKRDKERAGTAELKAVRQIKLNIRVSLEKKERAFSAYTFYYSTPRASPHFGKTSYMLGALDESAKHKEV